MEGNEQMLQNEFLDGLFWITMSLLGFFYLIRKMKRKTGGARNVRDPRDEKLIAKIMENLEQKDTAELENIWKERKKNTHSAEGVEAARRMLESRGHCHEPAPVKPSFLIQAEGNTGYLQRNGMVALGVILLVALIGGIAAGYISAGIRHKAEEQTDVEPSSGFYPPSPPAARKHPANPPVRTTIAVAGDQHNDAPADVHVVDVLKGLGPDARINGVFDAMPVEHRSVELQSPPILLQYSFGMTVYRIGYRKWLQRERSYNFFEGGVYESPWYGCNCSIFGVCCRCLSS
ncbi:MAG: hypothetical protein K9N51_03145 [Candidatus Pacebacteria bacterium]|nr:hypothetical protein [Candidatus Paceibacterota bacterium]